MQEREFCACVGGGEGGMQRVKWSVCVCASGGCIGGEREGGECLVSYPDEKEDAGEDVRGVVRDTVVGGSRYTEE